MSKQPLTREQLERQAEELGVKFRSNTSDATLFDRIKEAELALTDDKEESEVSPTVKSTGIKVFNSSKHAHAIGSKMVPPGGEYTLTDGDLSNERLMRRVGRAIQIGVLTDVTD